MVNNHADVELISVIFRATAQPFVRRRPCVHLQVTAAAANCGCA